MNKASRKRRIAEANANDRQKEGDSCRIAWLSPPRNNKKCHTFRPLGVIKKHWKESVNIAKKKHLPNVKDWESDGFATFRSNDIQRLWNLNLKVKYVKKLKIERISCSDLPLSMFQEKYESKEMPVLIQGIPNHFHWQCTSVWNISTLLKNFGGEYFKCGDGESCEDEVKMKLEDFAMYMKNQKDDTPLYIFDGSFDCHEKLKGLLKHYTVPPYFSEDLFALLGDTNRDHRWFLIGPKRSGTSVHIDPLGTSAWNTVIEGTKRWVLFPPQTPAAIATGESALREGEENGPSNYFVDLLPRIREDKSVAMIEFLQHPGETVFIPCGWWHGVINLTDTIAITQNYCSRTAFKNVWERTKATHKEIPEEWIQILTDESLTKQATRDGGSKSFQPQKSFNADMSYSEFLEIANSTDIPFIKLLFWQDYSLLSKMKDTES